ncbi:MAG: FAD-dependent oxidoreductase, partial [Bacteriovoracaceae bacterium]|nr:FAD-dependent oxidoreductase [Bacteriovoracaceae bacterium]
EVDATLVEREKPDAIIISPGSKWVVPDIPGKDRKNVVTTGQLIGYSRGFFKDKAQKIIILGGDLKGAESAEFFIRRGKQVTILKEDEQLWSGMNLQLQLMWSPWIAARQVPVYTGVTYEEITDKGVRIRTKEGDEKLVEADVVMIIAQDKKNDDLYKALVGRAPEVYLIGDGKNDANAWFDGAVHQGARAALKL